MLARAEVAGARPGQRVMVTGTIGDAALGLAVLKGGKVHAASDAAARATLAGRYRVPQPRMALAEIVRAYASAAMDVSDGLAGDLANEGLSTNDIEGGDTEKLLGVEDTSGLENFGSNGDCGVDRI